MIVVGLTGNFASGKTEAARIFKRLGARVFDADEAARKAVRKGTPAYKAILKIFGRSYLRRNAELDRQKLAWHVFTHPKALHKLNVLIHPGVIFESLKRIEKLRKNKGVLVLDVPLLFESKMENLVDLTVVVSASRPRMIARAVRKGLPKRLAERILSTQWPLKRKERVADFVIRNEGSLKDLKKEVLRVWNQVQGNT